MFRTAILCVILCWKLFAVQSFNLAPKPTIIIQDPTSDQFRINSNNNYSSYFGYTIVLRDKSIIIGAPRARTVLANEEPRETGAVYKYNIKSQKTAQFFFENPKQFGTFTKLEPNITEQWLGGAMDGGSTDADPLIVCAPQLKALQYLGSSTSIYMHGACYWTNNTLDIESQNRITWILSPLSTKGLEGNQVTIIDGKVVHDYKTGEAGFSVHITPNNDEILSGAVGIYNGAGAAIHFNMLTQSPKVSDRGPDFNGFKGYSVGSGYFENDKRQKLYYVATMPKAKHQFGLAQVYTKEPWKETYVLNLTGNQYGEIFGYSLLVEDVNGDGLDDILIGAPYRTVNDVIEVGAVYVYTNQAVKRQLNFKQSIIESPFPSGGRFGTTLTKLGDINGDGYNDVAIAAPFADGAGAVAIFFGGPDGLDAQPRQILKPGDQFAAGMFGHGLSKGVDIDGNSFNDLAIGAPNADTVFVYHAYPVVKINATIRPMESLIAPGAAELQCQICFNILTNSTNIQKLELELELSTDPGEKRINITNFQITRTYIASGELECLPYNFSLTFDGSSEYKPIVLELTYRLTHDAKLVTDSDFCDECAIVDPMWPSVSRASVQYLHNMVDLQLQSEHAFFNLTLGTTKILPVKYIITNVGEEAFGTLLTVQSSVKVPFAKLPAECTEVKMGGKVECNLANGRGFNGNTDIEVSFDLSNVVDVTEMNISASISSAGNELAPDNNKVQDTIKLISKAEVWIIEKARNEKFTIESEKQIATFATTFEIQNHGPSTLGCFNLFIDLPIGYKDGKETSQTYVSNIIAQLHMKDHVDIILEFDTSTRLTPSIFNATETLNLNHLNETRTTILSCQSGEKNDTKQLCASSALELSSKLQSGQNVILELSYNIEAAMIGELMVNNAEFLVHAATVNLIPVSKLNGGLDIKTYFKGAVFVKIAKLHTLWIYLGAAVGGLVLLVGVVWLLKRYGFFKRLTKEEMEKTLIEKEEKARMKEDLDECAAEMDEDVSDCEGVQLN